MMWTTVKHHIKVDVLRILTRVPEEICVLTVALLKSFAKKFNLFTLIYMFRTNKNVIIDRDLLQM